jgi:hypothetical protein
VTRRPAGLGVETIPPNRPSSTTSSGTWPGACRTSSGGSTRCCAMAPNVRSAVLASEDPTEAMGHGDDRHLVASARAQRHEVRMERMRGPPRVVRGLAEHRRELGGAALGDVPMPIPGPGLVGAGDEPRVAGSLLGRGKALGIAKRGHR